MNHTQPGRRRHPPIRCEWPHPGEQARPVGTTATTDTVTAVWVGDTFPHDDLDVPRIAEQLRDTDRRVLFIGDIHAAGRPLRTAIQAHWTAQVKAARQAAKTPAAPKAQPGRCGQPRTDGEPCEQAAGWGTDTPGAGPCRRHGGTTAKKAAAKRRAEKQAATVARLYQKATQGPLTPEEQLAAALALRDVLTALSKPSKHRTRTT